MKYLIFLLSSLSFATDMLMPLPKPEDWVLKKAYIPIGFDTNDPTVEVMTEGVLSNTCYRLHSYEVKKTGNKIEILQKVRLTPGLCLKIDVPFHELNEINTIDKDGDYTIIDGKSKKELGTLPIEKAKTINVDNFMYAPVSDVRVVTVNGKRGLLVEGTLSSSKLPKPSLKVTVQKNNVIVGLPIIAKDKLMTNNDDTPVPYQIFSEFEEELKNSNYLLHVRTIPGQAVNKMVEILK